MHYWEVLLLSVIEGITEFLPVSSTGHLVIASFFMNIEHDSFVKTFNIAIQFGAIFSVIVLYLKRFTRSIYFYFRLFVGFIPAAVIGLLFGDLLDEVLENVYVVAIMLIIGGIVLIGLDKWFDHKKKSPTINKVGYKQAFYIGVFQILALIPGTSRSAATIVGGLFQKLDKKTAVEFSFFLAVPTLFGATVYKLFKFYVEEGSFTSDQINYLLVGNVIAFISAAIAVKGFISLVSKSGFKFFGYYRIGLGLLVLFLSFFYS